MSQGAIPELTKPAPTIGRTTSLRTRLIAANAIITTVAVAVMGYYVYVRAQQSNAFLTQQLDISIRQQAQGNLTSVSNQQIESVNDFFASFRKDIADAGTSAGGLLSQRATLGGGAYWDAATSLSRLANGSWDNSSPTDPASVFIPARVELSDSLTTELNTLKNLDFVVPGKLQANPDAVAVYFGGLSGETVYYPNIDLANVVPPDFDVTQRPWFVAAAPAANPTHSAVWSVPYLDAALHGLIVTTSVPVFDAGGTFRGVIAMDVQLNRITDVVANIHVGQTGYAILVDKDRRVIAMPPAAYTDLGLTADQLPLGASLSAPEIAVHLPPNLVTILDKMTAGENGLQESEIRGKDRFSIYGKVPEVGYSLLITVPSSELLGGSAAAQQQLAASAAATTRISLLLVVGLLALTLLATYLLGNSLTSPLTSLTRTAEDIVRGNLLTHARVESRDEIGVLSQTLNAMTANLRGMIQSLERRVAERTTALESATNEANRRAAQFEAVTRVTRAISSIRNVDELLPQVTDVISQQFGYYHVGIFLNDDISQRAFLIAANSDGGQRMLARQHSLAIGEQGIVGYVAARGEPRVARNVGEDIVFFNNPDLPETRSEAALPLRSTDRIIGVLDVQSDREDAFRPDDIRVLAVLADQVSLAIENTRLFETTRRSLVEAETLYRQYVRDAWAKMQPAVPVEGLQVSGRRAGAFNATIRPTSGAEAAPPEKALHVPIKLRGEVIGDLVVQGQQDGQWTQDQVDLVQAVSERVALSMENARLFDETSRRAERERLVSEITSKIRSTNDPQEMVRTALDELRNVLGASQVQIIPQTLPEDADDEGRPVPSPN